jgi:phage tail-like protein
MTQVSQINISLALAAQVGPVGVAWNTEPDAAMAPSSYLDYLPAVFRQDEFMGRFLGIFESVLAPLEGVVDELPYYTDPTVCPEEVLPYLTHWVATEMGETWPAERQRRILAVAAELHRWRGTRRGLKAYLEAVTGGTPLVAENTDGSRLGPDNRLGLSARLGRAIPNHVTVTLAVHEGEEPDPTEVAALIEEQKPAHATYLLRIVARRARRVEGGGADGDELPEPAATEEA